MAGRLSLTEGTPLVWGLGSGYPYILFINNFSQCWALYCLVLLYEATAEELAPLKPLAKFLCVKGVVFFTFWQQAMLAVMAFFRVFTLNHRWECYTDMHDMINGIQVCAIAAGSLRGRCTRRHRKRLCRPPVPVLCVRRAS